MNVADILANAANLAFLLFLFTVIIRIVIKNKIAQLVLILCFSGFVLLVPCYHGVTIIGLVRGIVGDLSITSLLFILSLAVIYFIGLPINMFDRTFCMIISLIGLFLYLSVIDVVPIDVYRTGYLPHSFLVIIFLFCMLFLLLNYIFAIIWLIALIMFLAGLQNSPNLWDYLFDPVLWLICVYKFVFNRSLHE